MDAMDRHERTPLLAAASAYSDSLAKISIHDTHLSHACLFYIVLMKYLLVNGASPAGVDKLGCSLAHYLLKQTANLTKNLRVMALSLDVARYLLNSREVAPHISAKDINHDDTAGKTALCHMCMATEYKYRDELMLSLISLGSVLPGDSNLVR